MQVIKRAFAVLLAGSMIFLTGCWNYREIENLAIVAGFAVDKGENGEYKLTFDIVDVMSGGKEQAAKSKILESNGKTIFDAVRNVDKLSDKKLYFGDCKLVIFSQQLCEEGILPLLDWPNRDAELRIDLDVAVSGEKTAAEILKTPGQTNEVASYEIYQMIENDQKYVSTTPYVRLFEANNMLFNTGISLTLPVISLEEKEKQVSILTGTAVFQKDRMIGTLSSNETKSLLIIKNKVMGGLILFHDQSETPDIALEISQCNTSLTEKPGKSAPEIYIHVHLKAGLGEAENVKKYNDQNALNRLQKVASESVKINIEQLIEKVQQEYNSDIFGFGYMIYQNDPNYWSKLEPHWNAVFQKLKPRITVTVEIYNTAVTRSKIGMEK